MYSLCLYQKQQRQVKFMARQLLLCLFEARGLSCLLALSFNVCRLSISNHKEFLQSELRFSIICRILLNQQEIYIYIYDEIRIYEIQWLQSRDLLWIYYVRCTNHFEISLALPRDLIITILSIKFGMYVYISQR